MLRGFFHGVLCAAVATAWLWLGVTLSSRWFLIFSILVLVFMLIFTLFDPERLWRRWGSTLIASSLVPSGARAVAEADSTFGFVHGVGSFERLGIPEWIPLLVGVLLLFLDGVWLRGLALLGGNYRSTASRQHIQLATDASGKSVAFGKCYLKSGEAHDYTILDASIRDFVWMRALREVNIPPHGFTVLDPNGALLEPTPSEPIPITRRKQVELHIRLIFNEGGFLRRLRRFANKFGWGRERVTGVSVLLSDQRIDITVTAVQPERVASQR